jgi:hypothetical protein
MVVGRAAIGQSSAAQIIVPKIGSNWQQDGNPEQDVGGSV